MPIYTIEQGDTLSQIAQRNNRTIADLMGVNPQITDPNRIFAGQTLNIPSTQIPISPTTRTPAQPQTNQPPTLDMNQFNTNDPIRKFNLALLSMLKNAQSGQTSLSQEQAQLKREAYTSGQEVFTGEEAKMTPEAKMAALQRNVEMYEPSIQAATIKIEQLGRVMDLLSKTYGEDYKNLIPATKEDAAIFQKAMASGFMPPADIVERYGKFFTTEDWTALVEAQTKAEIAGRAPVKPPQDPTSIREYEYYSQQERDAGRTPMSYGEFGITQKAPSGAQQKAASYAGRVEQAESIFEDLDDYINNLTTFELWTQQKLPNSLRSVEYQKLDQAQRNFINATLRVESGAAIAETEFVNAKLQYFVQPGDSPEVIAQKKSNRQQVVANFKREAGTAYAPSEYLGEGDLLSLIDDDIRQLANNYQYEFGREKMIEDLATAYPEVNKQDIIDKVYQITKELWGD